MKRNFQVVLIALASLFALACACTSLSGLPGAGSLPATIAPINNLPLEQPTEAIPATESSAQPVVGTVILQDDFSSDTGKLENYKDDNGKIGVSGGVYSIENFADKWMWGKISSTSTDSYIEVDASQVSGPDDNNTGYGVICRLKHTDADGLDGYIFAISGDGYASINLIQKNKFTPLVDWTSTSAINQGDSSNHLRASCLGDKLSFEVNGTVVAETTDSTHTSGDAGFAGISFNETSRDMQVDFDNLFVSEP